MVVATATQTNFVGPEEVKKIVTLVMGFVPRKVYREPGVASKTLGQVGVSFRIPPHAKSRWHHAKKMPFQTLSEVARLADDSLNKWGVQRM